MAQPRSEAVTVGGAAFIDIHKAVLSHFTTMPLVRSREPFSHPHLIFEVKWGGFRVLLPSDTEHVKLISRNGNHFKPFLRRV